MASQKKRKRPSSGGSNFVADNPFSKRKHAEESQPIRRRLRGKQTWPPRVVKGSGSEFYPPLAIEVSFDSPLQRVMYLMRGPPGCGKSTAAKHILQTHLRIAGVIGDQHSLLQMGQHESLLHRAFILSTDDYFTDISPEGWSTYTFEPSAIPANHQKNQARCEVAMQLAMTPLIIDNTNSCLWEMRAYVQLADAHGYKVRIVDPRLLSDGALDVETLKDRVCQDRPGRVAGKELSESVLHRMVANFEDLDPDGWNYDDAMIAACTEAKVEDLDAILAAESQHDRKPRGPLYVGLDVECKALASLGGLDLPAAFLQLPQEPESAECMKPPSHGMWHHYMDVRYDEQETWKIPPRLHVTVRFFGRGNPPAEVKEQVQALVESTHDVEVHGLLAIAGGGLLCAVCAIPSQAPGDEALRSLAPEDWRPHITLATRWPWRPVDSTAVILAWEKAQKPLPKVTKSDEASEVPCEDTSTSHLLDATLPLAGSDGGLPPAGSEASAVAEPASQVDSTQLEESQAELEPTQPESPAGGAEDAPPPASEIAKVLVQGPDLTSAKPPPARSTATSEKEKAREEVYRDVDVQGRQVDLCYIPIHPPLRLERCVFRMFDR